MKKFYLVLLVTIIVGCSSNNDCKSEKEAINKKYDEQVQYVKDHPDPDGINYRQIELLNNERNKKLAEACD